MEELLATWKREADAALSARVVNGLPIDLFKVIAERKVCVYQLKLIVILCFCVQGNLSRSYWQRGRGKLML